MTTSLYSFKVRVFHPFHHPPNHLDFSRTDWVKFQNHLEDQISFNPVMHNGKAMETCVKNFSVALLKSLLPSTPNIARVMNVVPR
jgi:hypothetical protein